MSNGQQNQTTALATTGAVKQLQVFLNTRMKTLASYATKRTNPDTLIKLALYEFANSEWLQRCSMDSVYASLITAAQLGLEVGAAKGEAYLVPFKGKCQLIPGYRGYIKMALRSKAVKAVYSHVVYEGDEFMIELGSEPRVVHRPQLDGGDRGAIRGVYAVAQMVSGAIDVEWMPLDELERIREIAAKGRGGKDSQPYQEHTAEMYRKSPIRRLAKRLPMGDDFFAASHLEDQIDAGKEPTRVDLLGAGGDVVDADVVEQPSSLGAKVAKAAQAVDEPPKQ